MIIYENILKRINGKKKNTGDFWIGPTALLQQMMQYNKNFELVPVSAVP
jgi:hypothetical protein